MCDQARSGEEAIKLIENDLKRNNYKKTSYNLIFMDCNMPEMDGYEATKAIKETEKYLAHNTPIIAVSASAFEEDIQNAKKAGIDDFLAKPIESDKLKELLIKYAPKDNGAIA